MFRLVRTRTLRTQQTATAALHERATHWETRGLDAEARIDRAATLLLKGADKHTVLRALSGDDGLSCVVPFQRVPQDPER